MVCALQLTSRFVPVSAGRDLAVAVYQRGPRIICARVDSAKFSLVANRSGRTGEASGGRPGFESHQWISPVLSGESKAPPLPKFATDCHQGRLPPKAESDDQENQASQMNHERIK